MSALENSSELERIARAQTGHIPPGDHFGKAKALDTWMHSHITYRPPNAYRYNNSVETIIEGAGACGEQAFLYIVLCRNAGVDASYHANQDHTHAMAGIEAGGRTVFVEYTPRPGFDITPQEPMQEYTDEEVEEEYLRLNGMIPAPQPVCQPIPSPIFAQPGPPWAPPCPGPIKPPCPAPIHEPTPWPSPHHDHYCHPQPHYPTPIYVNPPQVKLMALAACVIVPMVFAFSNQFRLTLARARPILATDGGRPYVTAAMRAAKTRMGEDGEKAVLLLKEGYDLNNDHALDTNEAYALYKQVMEETGQ